MTEEQRVGLALHRARQRAFWNRPASWSAWLRLLDVELVLALEPPPSPARTPEQSYEGYLNGPGF